MSMSHYLRTRTKSSFLSSTKRGFHSTKITPVKLDREFTEQLGLPVFVVPEINQKAVDSVLLQMIHALEWANPSISSILGNKKLFPVKKQKAYNVVHIPEKDFVYLTVPPRTSEINDGATNNASPSSSECILKGGQHLAAILSIPNFPTPVPQLSEALHRIGPSKHGSLGVFATRDIDIGDLIYAERPLLVKSRDMHLGLRSDLYKPGAKLSIPQLIEKYGLECEELERYLELCVERMSPRDRKSFFELYNAPVEVPVGYRFDLKPIFGRSKANAVQVLIEGVQEGLPGTFAVASRLNHSCVPNVTRHFNTPSFSLRLHAIRPIKSGEEMFIPYFNPNVSLSDRQIRCKQWAFKCTCPACSDPEWDTRLSHMMKSDKFTTGSGSETSAERTLEHSLKWIKTIEDAGAQFLLQYQRHLLRAGAMAERLGIDDESERNIEKAKKMYYANEGDAFRF